MRVVAVRHGRGGLPHKMHPQIVYAQLWHVDHLPGRALLAHPERVGGLVTEIAAATLATTRATGAVPIHAHRRGRRGRDIVDGAVVAVLRVLTGAAVEGRPIIDLVGNVIGEHGVGGHLVRGV